MRFPDAEEAIACKGTAIEQPTVTVGKKAFLFLGNTRIMVKLRDSIPEAVKLAKEQPEVYKIGAGGWTTITIDVDNTPPTDLLKGWVEESYKLMAAAKPKKKPTAKRRKP
jgi:hypothetical protein